MKSVLENAGAGPVLFAFLVQNPDGLFQPACPSVFWQYTLPGGISGLVKVLALRLG